MKLSAIAVNESGLSRLHAKQVERSTGAITAYRGEFTKAQNQARNRSLQAKLMALRYSITSIDGSYIENYQTDDAREVKEHSFFVASDVVGDDKGKLEHDLIALGAEFDQDSILSIPFGGEARLIGTSHRENAYPQWQEVATVGQFKGGKTGEFMSRIRNRAFIFEDIELPVERAGRLGVSVFAKKHWTELLE